jgi:CHAD domain-containing protein
MADGKWIQGLHGGMALPAAARQVLTVRLEVVQERLPLAVTQAEADPEHVHQLRVGTRRAGAAVRIFADILPERLHRRTRKTLRRLRRAAGAARDWDVFLQTLTTRLARISGKNQRGLDLLLGYGHGRRVSAQANLVAAAEERGERLPELTLALANALDDDKHDGKLRDLAVPTLTQLLQELEEAARGDLTEYEHLHQVRILGKQLRYAMEVFESCFAPAFREQYYPAIVQMQEILGHANDGRVAAELLRELRVRLKQTQPAQWPDYEAGIEHLLRYHERRVPQQRRAFIAWWQEWQSSGAEEAFASLILHGE